MTKNDADTFETSDFYVSAYVLALGHKIAYVNRDNPQRVVFGFGDFQGREELLRDFLYRRSQIEPNALIDAIKSLKGLLHSHD